VDKNFAVHLPVLDWLFGTYYLPDRWPHVYGLAKGKVPEGYFRQMAYPFRLRA
jgi:lathosterol oxidase